MQRRNPKPCRAEISVLLAITRQVVYLKVMDMAFLFDESSRANFFQLIMQSIPYTYICLWTNWPQPSRYYSTLSFLYMYILIYISWIIYMFFLNSFLRYVDGFFYEENNQPSSSSGTPARRLFEEYRQSVFMVENE